MSREVNEKIAALLKEAEAKIEEAERLAKEAGVDFHCSGPSYGMGGYFGQWNDSGCSDDDSSEDGFHPRKTVN